MKKLLFLLIAGYSFTATAQKLPDIGLYKIHLTDTDKTIVADINLVSKPPVKQDLYYHWYNANMIHVTQGGYSGKLLNGTYTELYLNKNVKVQGSFKNGLMHNTWKTWNINGLLINVYNWDEGIMNGEFRLYDGKGKVLEKGTYKKGRLNGLVRTYSEPDSVKVVNYADGKIVPLSNSSFWSKFNPKKLFHHPKPGDTTGKHK